MIILQIVDRYEVWVDNDFGTVLPGDLFVMRLLMEPKWSWTKDLEEMREFGEPIRMLPGHK